MNKKEKTLISLIIIVVLGITLRGYNLGARSIHFDEMNSLIWSGAVTEYTADLPDGWDLIKDPIYNVFPLYYWILQLWMRLVSPSEIMLRIISVIFGVALIPVVYLIASELFSKKVGLLSAFFAATSPFFIYYSQFGKAYSLMFFTTSLSLYFFLTALKYDKNRFWVGYSFVLVLSILSHYYAI